MFFSSIVLAVGLVASQPAAAFDSIQPVTVVSDRGVVVSKTDSVRFSSSIDIASALLQIPDLVVSDGGGMAGLKTVNLRGLGAAHTAIYVDGVRIGNMQSGQTDLGMIDISGLGSAVVDYAQNSLSFTTAKPVFGSRPVAGSVNFRGGSFSTFEPAARLDFKLSDRLCMSASGSGIFSKGDFRLPDGSSRENNDIRQARASLDFWGLLSGGDWHAKAYFNGAERGAPGTLDWPSTDRQKDRNVFAQCLLRKQFTPVYLMNLSGKVSYDDLFYYSSWGDDRYRQTELQLNSSHKFRVARWISLSLAADLQWDYLGSTQYDAARTTIVSAAAAAFRTRRFAANVALEYFGAFDRDAESRNCLSPSADIRVALCSSLDFVALARRSYRVPTFNELYYAGFGNPLLKPEDAFLADLGLEWKRSLSSGWSFFAKLDGFYQYLQNKIISAPTEDPNIWQPYNIGVVRSLGLDAQAGFAYSAGKWRSDLKLSYALQDATDRTPESASYGSQIPFIARNTLSVNGDLSYAGWSLNAVWNLRGGRTDSYGALADWNTLDLSAGKEFRLGRGLSLALKLMARNLTDCRYELSTGYPMPGRSLTAGVDFRF